ncbi:hypothetical protein Hanom_Chr00s128164g01814351 [Helianthus anomalus]
MGLVVGILTNGVILSQIIIYQKPTTKEENDLKISNVTIFKCKVPLKNPKHMNKDKYSKVILNIGKPDLYVAQTYCVF